jgi:hypothetical protein
MHTKEQTRASLACVGSDFLHDRITEQEWRRIRGLDELWAQHENE